MQFDITLGINNLLTNSEFYVFRSICDCLNTYYEIHTYKHQRGNCRNQISTKLIKFIMNSTSFNSSNEFSYIITLASELYAHVPHEKLMTIREGQKSKLIKMLISEQNVDQSKIRAPKLVKLMNELTDIEYNRAQILIILPTIVNDHLTYLADDVKRILNSTEIKNKISCLFNCDLNNMERLHSEKNLYLRNMLKEYDTLIAEYKPIYETLLQRDIIAHKYDTTGNPMHDACVMLTKQNFVDDKLNELIMSKKQLDIENLFCYNNYEPFFDVTSDFDAVCPTIYDNIINSLPGLTPNINML